MKSPGTYARARAKPPANGKAQRMDPRTRAYELLGNVDDGKITTRSERIALGHALATLAVAEQVEALRAELTVLADELHRGRMDRPRHYSASV